MTRLPREEKPLLFLHADRDFLLQQEIGLFGADLLSDLEEAELPANALAGIREKLTVLVRGLLERAPRLGIGGNLWQGCLTDALVNDENAYSLACERQEAPGGTLREAACQDMALYAQLYRVDLERYASLLGMPSLLYIRQYETDTLYSRIYNRTVRERIAALNEALAAEAQRDAPDTPGRMLRLLSDFYGSTGVGAIGLHKAFRVQSAEEEGRAEITPVRNIRHVTLSDLVGYEEAKRKLTENTKAFLAGASANNCLLYGDAGTGKSSAIMAITNMYFGEGLRVIELYKHQAQLLHDVINQIKDRNYRFIVYMDDLSFEDFETDYKYLKAVIEGGLEKRPDNVLIYATSNRRHLIRESFSDKRSLSDDDIHRGDTVQEKLSLAYRFGMQIYFGAPDKAGYERIVLELAKRSGLSLSEEELLSGAIRFEMAHGGKSGRTAAQYIQWLSGAEGLSREVSDGRI